MLYRIKQFWWARTAQPLSKVQWLRVQGVLASAELLTLFSTQSNSDQQHTLRILNLLQSPIDQNNSLLKAALLHDVGKTRLSISILDRVFVVLASLFIPKRSATWGLDPQPPFRYRKSFVMKHWHPAWGADMAAAAGADQLTINLIRRHQDALVLDAAQASKEEKLLQRLQWADDQS
ncbi:MAG: HD domain-containing protein [Candidatus Promineifilaceae bacterium]